LDEHRFARASLQGKLVNRSGDLGAYAPKTSTVFKSIVGGDPVLAEHKGQQTFPLYNTAKLLFAGNSFAGTHESGAAYSQRWLVIPFTVEHEPNPDFLGSLTTPAEMRGLLRHAVEGARRLIERKTFTRPAQVELAEASLQIETDNVRRFVEETLEIQDGSELSGPGLYRQYRDWAKDANLHAAGAPNLNGKLGDIPGIRVELRSGRRKWVLGVKNNFPSADPKTVVENWKSRNKDGI
jgi:phage/plasmid-associated DNA primase